MEPMSLSIILDGGTVMNENQYEVTVGQNQYTYISTSGDILKNGVMWDKNTITDFSEVDTRRKLCITKEQWLNGEVLQSLWLSISHNCNMTCDYCYADSGTYGAASLMDIDTEREAIDFFFKYLKKDTRKIRVNFFGGEPLLNKKALLVGVDYINKKAKQLNKEVRYIITTNGTLIDDDILTVLKDNHFSVNISLDGNEMAQNSSRRYNNGKFTYRDVWKGINNMLAADIEVMARMTITNKNIRYFKESVEEIWDRGIEFVYFSLVQTQDEQLTVKRKDIKQFAEDVQELVSLGNARNGKGLLGDLGNIAEYEHRIGNKLILKECKLFSSFNITCTPNGDIYTCNRVIGNTEYVAGNIYDGIEWGRLKQDYKCPMICKKCWARHICAGGCPIIPDQLECELNKMLIEIALKDYIILKEKVECKGEGI